MIGCEELIIFDTINNCHRKSTNKDAFKVRLGRRRLRNYKVGETSENPL